MGQHAQAEDPGRAAIRPAARPLRPRHAVPDRPGAGTGRRAWPGQCRVRPPGPPGYRVRRPDGQGTDAVVGFAGRGSRPGEGTPDRRQAVFRMRRGRGRQDGRSGRGLVGGGREQAVKRARAGAMSRVWAVVACTAMSLMASKAASSSPIKPGVTGSTPSRVAARTDSTAWHRVDRGGSPKAPASPLMVWAARNTASTLVRKAEAPAVSRSRTAASMPRSCSRQLSVNSSKSFSSSAMVRTR